MMSVYIQILIYCHSHVYRTDPAIMEDQVVLRPERGLQVDDRKGFSGRERRSIENRLS